jgi:hypothetical protein
VFSRILGHGCILGCIECSEVVRRVLGFVLDAPLIAVLLVRRRCDCGDGRHLLQWFGSGRMAQLRYVPIAAVSRCSKQWPPLRVLLLGGDRRETLV